jgi:alpha-galactosidase
MPSHLHHLAAPGVSLVIDTAGGAPAMLHWGAALDPADDLDATAGALERPVPAGGLDVVAPIAIVPEHGSGYPGRPGLRGRRDDGTAWAPRFRTVDVTADAGRLVVVGDDPIAGLRLTSEIELDQATGVTRVRATLADVAGASYHLDGLALTLPLPPGAGELLTFTGRWCRELHPRRQPFSDGAASVAIENRSGRTSHDRPPTVWAGTVGFGEWSGEVWGAHLAWSGNAEVVAESMSDGRLALQLGELLHPGELTIPANGSYATPWVVAVYAGTGLTAASQALHRWIRARPQHPSTPRPVMLNSWEAVFFDHDRERLFDLAERAAGIGIERFVLDDGWFSSRRDDTSGLGDWWVSPAAHPGGLDPLIAHVRSLGMDFGIWVEPEMISPDSDLYRAHPEWALAVPGYEAVRGRSQLVLDLARPDAFRHVAGRLDALLGEHDIAYVKWDMNRDHVHGAGADGRAGSRAQTLATYRLLDELRTAHSGVEFESCASGGGRVDLGILERTERVWTSDCNDALERQTIQRGTSLLIPPELMGAHVGAARAHTTGRMHTLAFRAATALFGHFGIEWNLLDLSDAELDDLRQIVAVHKEHRPLLHTGDVVRFDGVGEHALAHGVYSSDRSAALVAFVQLHTAPAPSPAPLRLPGLEPTARYSIDVLPLPGGWEPTTGRGPEWPAKGIVLSGRQLAAHGVQLPVMAPESALLLRLRTGG